MSTPKSFSTKVELARRSHCEIFHMSILEQTEETCFWNREDNEALGAGWFYWCCFPGCLPEGDPIGPFMTWGDAFGSAEENGYINTEEVA